jgi:hypothetical protein
MSEYRESVGYKIANVIACVSKWIACDTRVAMTARHRIPTW